MAGCVAVNHVTEVRPLPPERWWLSSGRPECPDGQPSCRESGTRSHCPASVAQRIRLQITDLEIGGSNPSGRTSRTSPDFTISFHHLGSGRTVHWRDKLAVNQWLRLLGVRISLRPPCPRGAGDSARGSGPRGRPFESGRGHVMDALVSDGMVLPAAEHYGSQVARVVGE